MPMVIDHLGQLAQPGGVASEGFAALSRLLATGRVWTKLSAPYNTSKSGAPEYFDFGQVASELVKRKADRLMWGSDWPHPTMKSEKPDDAKILDLLAVWAPAESDRRLILRDNAVKLYGFNTLSSKHAQRHCTSPTADTSVYKNRMPVGVLS